jgi:hypothetical protein
MAIPTQTMSFEPKLSFRSDSEIIRARHTLSETVVNSNKQDIHEIEGRLKTAQERLERAIARLAPKHKGGEWEEYKSANQEVLRLERLLGAARGDEYAEPIEFPVKWDTGVPLPHLIVNDYRALLAFLLCEPDPTWDGTYVTVKSPAGNDRSLWHSSYLSTAYRQNSGVRMTKYSVDIR